MKLRESLAERDWRVQKTIPDWEVIDGRGDEEHWIFIAACSSRETATAIAALPKLYLACLMSFSWLNELRRISSSRIYDDEAFTKLFIALEGNQTDTRLNVIGSAIDAAICTDEPEGETR